MQSFAAFVPLIACATAELSSGSGIVGYGRTLFRPECGFACLSTLWSLSLPCSQGGANSTFSINSPACHASNDAYLQSLAWCLQDYCPNEGVDSTRIEKFWQSSAGDGLQVGDWQSYLIARPTTTLPFGETRLTESTLVDSTKYDNSKMTLQSYASQESYHSLYGIVLIVGSLGFALLIGLGGILNALALRYFHRPATAPTFLKKYLLDPATFRRRTAQMLPYKMGYVPQRRTMILIVIFCAVNVAFNFPNFPNYGDDTWYLSASKLYNANLANRLGILAVVNMAMAIVFSGRNSFVIYMTGCSRTTLMAIHRWTGRIAVIKGVAHGAIYLSTSSRYGSEIFTRAAALKYIGCESTYWEFGIATLAVLLATFLLSLAPVRIYWYEAFLIAHVALGIAGLITLWYHLQSRFHGQYGYQVWLYVAFAFWIFDRTFRLLRLAVLNFDRFTGKSPPAVIELLANGELIKVTTYTSRSCLNKPGQHCFVYFPTLTLFWESHPFSIISSVGCINDVCKYEEHHLASDDMELQSRIHPNVQNATVAGKSFANGGSTSDPAQFEISFLIRPGDGITKKLRDLLAAAQSSLSIPVLIEGPYGSSTMKTFASESIVAFAGGVGITGILGHLNHYIEMSKAIPSPATRLGLFRARKFTLIWAVKSQVELDAIRPFLPDEKMARDAEVELHIVCKETGDERLNWRAEIAKAKRGMDRSHSLCVLVCGPPSMADDIRRAVVQEHDSNTAKIDLIQEMFAW